MNALAAIERLRARAAAGDKRARVELAKLGAALRVRQERKQAQLAGLVFASGAADHVLGLDAAQSDDEIVAGEDDLEDAAFVANKMEHADELTRKAALRNHKWQGLDKVAPFQRINPPSALRGTLGGQQQVSSDGPAIQVVNWAADADAEALPVTITLAPVSQFTTDTSFANLDPNQMPARPLSIVQFGTRGFLVQAFVDIGTGCQFTIGCSMVTVQVALAPTIPGTKPISMKLAGMASFYPCVRSSPLTRTLYSDANITAGTPALFNVPPFAKRLVVERSLLTASLLVILLDSQGNPVAEYPIAANAAQFEPLDVPGDAVFLEVFPGAATPPTSPGCRAVFELAL